MKGRGRARWQSATAGSSKPGRVGPVHPSNLPTPAEPPGHRRHTDPMRVTRGERLAGWWAVPGAVCLGLWLLDTCTGGSVLHRWSEAGGLTITQLDMYTSNNCFTLSAWGFESERLSGAGHQTRWRFVAYGRVEGLYKLSVGGRAGLPNTGINDFRTPVWMFRHGLRIAYSRADHLLSLTLPLPLLVLVFAGPWMWYRLRRWKYAAVADALCPDCGYDVRGLERGCPECGWSRWPNEDHAA